MPQTISTRHLFVAPGVTHVICHFHGTLSWKVCWMIIVKKIKTTSYPILYPHLPSLQTWFIACVKITSSRQLRIAYSICDRKCAIVVSKCLCSCENSFTLPQEFTLHQDINTDKLMKMNFSAGDHIIFTQWHGACISPNGMSKVKH